VVRENAPPAPTKSVPLPWYVQARNALHTTAGRLVTIFAGLSLVLLFILFVRPPSPAPRADSPLTSITMGTSGDGTILNFNATTSFCRWNGYQLIGKRWDSSTQSWQNIAIGEATTGAAPDIIVALEQIDACGDRIEITWSVQNNTNRSVSFPLRHNNIKISDGLGNDYPLANDDSRPAVINVLPGTRQRGVAVVRRQLAANASTLRIKLIEQPFGEASFIVALQP